MGQFVVLCSNTERVVKNKSDPALTEVREEVELCWNLL